MCGVPTQTLYPKQSINQSINHNNNNSSSSSSSSAVAYLGSCLGGGKLSLQLCNGTSCFVLRSQLRAWAWWRGGGGASSDARGKG